MTSNSRAFSMMKATFSAEIASSGIVFPSRSSLVFLGSGDNAARHQMIHCASWRKPACFGAKAFSLVIPGRDVVANPESHATISRLRVRCLRIAPE
ncbi:hypothetical protein [Bradyrhizobium diazoefficiens]